MNDYNIRFYAVRPDNDRLNSDPAIIAKRGKTIKARYTELDGPYAEWKQGRPSMDRTNITTEHLNSNPEIVKKKIENSKAYNASPEGRQKYLKGREKVGTPVIGPDGTEYATTVIAQDATGVPCRKIRTFAKNNLKGWQYK